MEIQCLGSIESVYWKSNEESVTGDRQMKTTNLLESKKPVSATSTSNTRADRVHGKYECDCI